MNVLILEDEQRNFNRLRRQLEEIDTTFHVEGPLPIFRNRWNGYEPIRLRILYLRTYACPMD